MSGWRFWIDRGGTFTDVIAISPSGRLETIKLLSENPSRYADAAVHAIRQLTAVPAGPLPPGLVDEIKLGTTVATNALLERKGAPTLLVTTAGLADLLLIRQQNRPRLFDLRIEKPQPLFEEVLEARERVGADGEVIRPLDEAALAKGLSAARDRGLEAAAVAFMHAYRRPEHEERAAALARAAGFREVTTSVEASPLMKLVPRAETALADAYLTPVLKAYIEGVAAELGPNAPLAFMQSSGGLTSGAAFRGRNAVLSGPAGGVVGMARAAAEAGLGAVIGFDMGGTSTDVSHYAGGLERSFDTEVAGVRLRTPMMSIHTVAAGGGSIIRFDKGRFRVGPDSAGAMPGPACYRRGGPLTVTDCNVMTGRLRPERFPAIFGDSGAEPLDAEIVRRRFEALAAEASAATGRPFTAETTAEGFLSVAVDSMARAIKTVSVARGHDVTRYALVCFGGAAGQHACLVADALGMSKILVHPFASVLSAYGVGLADHRKIRQSAVERLLDAQAAILAGDILEALASEAVAELEAEGFASAEIRVELRAHVRYQGSDTALETAFSADVERLRARFETAHEGLFSTTSPETPLVLESVTAEALAAPQPPPKAAAQAAGDEPPLPRDRVEAYMNGAFREVAVFERLDLRPRMQVKGPAILVDATSTTIIEPGWTAGVLDDGGLLLVRDEPRPPPSAGPEADPVALEIFNNLFMSVAEEMGAALQNTASSVNIKERLDFSCAVFDAEGALIANAPHMPVHLGSMGESVRAALTTQPGPGDVVALNNPYNGGTHLPDVTVVMPVFAEDATRRLFIVAARGHHADIGGVTPGSMPPDSRSLAEEGVLIDNLRIVSQGRFDEAAVRAALASGPYPARNPDQNVADLKAQVAACARGAEALRGLARTYGEDVVAAYMGHVKANAAACVRRMLRRLPSGRFTCAFDDGAQVVVSLEVDAQNGRARIDFTGTSDQRPTNFNAPASVCRAAVLYVLRTLIAEDIPLNDGCLEPVELIIPEGSMLNPRPPAAVVAGNVETSQIVTDALYGACGRLAASQGTMNNFTFGDETRQYYETLCGGAGAGPGFEGASAVQTHMTNSRLTDPEVLEARFPVRLERFEIRRGSGGEGRWRGGDGVVRALRFLEPMTASLLSNRRTTRPFGLDGGGDALPGSARIERAGGEIEALGGTAKAQLAAGDLFVIETPGGGGFGQARSPALAKPALDD